MWSDNESEIDLLGFEHLSNAVVSIVQKEHLLPATIGVYGDWGSGKSSLLQIIAKQLEAEEGTIVLTFNGWLFEDYEDAKTALMGSILEELSEHQRILPAVKEKVKGLLKRVNGFKVALGVGKVALGLGTGLWPIAMSGGLDFLSVATALGEKGKDIKAEDLKSLIKEKDEKEEEKISERRRQIREFRKDFEKVLVESDIKRLVVIIDDLDRCLPDTILETLEAIKLFLFVKNTAFILGADERLVTYAVRTRFPELPGEKVEVGRDYLEKLIQFPLRVPPLGPLEMESYIALLFAGLTKEISSEARSKATGIALRANAESNTGGRISDISRELFGDELDDDLKEQLLIAGRIAPLLAAGLKGNPRQCKRFLNTLLVRTEMARFRGIELQQRVLAKLMLLEYFRPESFRKLAELQGFQNGKPRELALLERSVNQTGTSQESIPVPADAKEIKHIESGKNRKIQKVAASTQPAETFPEENELEPWLKQDWTRHWISMEPSLAEIDLRPYFYFSRDLLSGLQTGDFNRMSPAARDVLSNLLSESSAVRNLAVEKFKSLSLSDSVAVFEALVRRAEDLEQFGSNNAPLQLLFELAEARKEIASELILFLGRLPETSIHPVISSQVLRLAKGEVKPSALELLNKWSKSSNELLGIAAQQRIQRLRG